MILLSIPMGSITPQQLTAAAHARLPHANPLSVEQMNRLVSLALASRPRTALEIGCGPGTFSIALAEQGHLDVTAIDINPTFLDRARHAAAQRVLMGTVSFEQRPASDYRGPEVDLVVCIGSSQALGTPRAAIGRAASLLRPGGTLVFADLIWSSPPPSEFLEFLGCTDDLYWTTETSTAVFARANLGVVAELQASRASWREYEQAVRQGRLALADSLPSEQAQTVRSKAETWFQAYEQYGQHCLGFAACVARLHEGPKAPEPPVTTAAEQPARNPSRCNSA